MPRSLTTLARGRLERYAKRAVFRSISGSPRWRGTAARDGRATLLTVDYHTTDHVRRLIASFDRFVDPSWPVVVVQNGSRRANAGLRPRSRCVGWGLNLGHGLALDLGMRQVRTEYTLICDPDSIICSSNFPAEVIGRVERHGVASIEREYYHPICLCFPTELWKTGSWSFQEDWSNGLDVAGQLTRELGGVQPEAQLRLTRQAPEPDGPAWRGSSYGQVWSEVFSNTYAVSRKHTVGSEIDGNPTADVERYQELWARWADALVAGRETLEEFPTHV